MKSTAQGVYLDADEGRTQTNPYVERVSVSQSEVESWFPLDDARGDDDLRDDEDSGGFHDARGVERALGSSSAA